MRAWSISQSIAIETFSIVLGVLLALGVNEWREHRRAQTQAQVALQQVEAEIRANHARLARIHPANGNTVRALLAALDNGTPIDPSLQFGPELRLQNIAWRTAQTTGAWGHVNYDRVLVLAEVYAVQETYLRLSDRFMQAAMQGAAYAAVEDRSPRPAALNREYRSIYTLIHRVEGDLLRAYEHVAPDLAEAAGAP